MRHQATWNREMDRVELTRGLWQKGIRSRPVLDAIEAIPRHLFVPESLQPDAYVDNALTIGYGQTISQPYIVALMSELLDLNASIRVLEVGTGSGYQTMVLSRLAGEIFTIENVSALASSARELLTRIGVANVHWRVGDGYQGWPDGAPFDRIILTAAPTRLPDTLLDQLARGGRMVAPVGAVQSQQELLVIDKDDQGRIRQRAVTGVAFVPMVPGVLRN